MEWHLNDVSGDKVRPAFEVSIVSDALVHGGVVPAEVGGAGGEQRPNYYCEGAPTNCDRGSTMGPEWLGKTIRAQCDNAAL